MRFVVVEIKRQGRGAIELPRLMTVLVDHVVVLAVNRFVTGMHVERKSRLMSLGLVYGPFYK
jgi:hypothetical protein